jgi:hypothetical protein
LTTSTIHFFSSLALIATFHSLSGYLLSGVLRCGVCGARMIAQTATRKKGIEVYRCGWYRCGFARAKGPAVCSHSTGYRRERLEGALLARFREAMTPERSRILARSVNSQIETVFNGHNARTAHVTEEIRRLENQVSNLVRFLANGGDSVAVRSELAERPLGYELFSNRHQRRNATTCRQTGHWPSGSRSWPEPVFSHDGVFAT